MSGGGLAVGASHWFPTPRARMDARLSLFCFPHAGGDVISYLNWPRGLPSDIELRCVALPGKYGRAAEPALPTFDAAVDHLEAAIGPLLDRPFAFFGHSMGALLAFELAHRLHTTGRSPRRVFLSGMQAPARYRLRRRISAFSDAEVIDYLRSLEGTPEAILRSPDIMALIAPAVRSDFRICETYSHRPGRRLTCPLHVFAGREDVTPEDANAWQEEAAAGFKLEWFPGGHMFVATHQSAVIERVAAGLKAA